MPLPAKNAPYSDVSIIHYPGEDAINAALFPDEDFSDYFYFRHDKNGKIYMAKTQAEHDENGNEVLRVNSQY